MSTWVHLLQYTRLHLLPLLVFLSSLSLFKEEFWLMICHVMSASVADKPANTVSCTWAAGCYSISKQPVRALCPAAVTQESKYHLAERRLSLCPPEAASGPRWQQIKKARHCQRYHNDSDTSCRFTQARIPPHTPTISPAFSEKLACFSGRYPAASPVPALQKTAVFHSWNAHMGGSDPQLSMEARLH